jgi:uncharacterized coiled-coil DUF342 family protein
MSLVEILVVAVLLVALLVLVLLAAANNKRKRQEAELAARIEQLQQDLRTYNGVAAGIGRQVMEISQKLLDTTDRIDELESSSSHESNYELAQKLMEKGEALANIEEQCQIGEAEAKLLEKVSKSRGE